MKLHTIMFAVAFTLLGGMAHAVPFEKMKFNQDINTNVLQTLQEKMNSTNGTLVVRASSAFKGEIPVERVNASNGITFDVYEDGEVKFFFDTQDDQRNPCDRIFVNGLTLNQIFQTNMVEAANVNNPLWRKKLAIVGDSLTMNPYPSEGKRYVDYISERNNMVLVNKGMSGRQLCNSTQTIPSLISTYSTDIPSDADFILCQIGANDVNKKWTTAQGNDTDMTTNTFKGCWNLLLVGMKTQFPNAKVGIILAHNWRDNLGEKSEMAITNNARRALTQWQKIQCQKLNIPVFDPVEDTRFFTYNLKVYEGD